VAGDAEFVLQWRQTEEGSLVNYHGGRAVVAVYSSLYLLE
jgi:hypothetical protein